MMKYLRYLTAVAILLSLFYLIFPQTAYAYLDPGSGSYILQLIIAGLLGAAFAVKIFWSSIKAFFSNILSKGQE